jgi:hypothetical protein
MNYLHITGDDEALAAFWAKMPNGKLSFHRFHPNPYLDENGEVKPNNEGDAWYDWACENWGTKWDLCDDQTTGNFDGITLDFMTAWSPPIAFIVKVSKDYPDLRFALSYNEPAMDCGGFTVYKNGERVTNLTFEDFAALVEPDENEPPCHIAHRFSQWVHDHDDSAGHCEDFWNWCDGEGGCGDCDEWLMGPEEEEEEDSLERQCLDCDRTFMEDPINKEARWHSTKCGLCTGNTGLCDVCGTEVIWEDLIIDDDDDEMVQHCADCHKSSSNAVD